MFMSYSALLRQGNGQLVCLPRLLQVVLLTHVHSEWYDPDAVTTANGSLVFTITQQRNHNLDYRSAMIQSWNQFCFTGGYIETRIQLPGSDAMSGFWPGAWTMGNLGRAGFGATNEGA